MSQSIIRKAQVWVFHGAGEARRVLLLQVNPDRGSFWQPMTGTVEPHESFLEGAARELQEETAVQGALVDTGYEFEFDGRWGRARERVFAVQCGEVPSVRLDGREHQSFEWMKPDEALKRLKFDSNREGLMAALKMA